MDIRNLKIAYVVPIRFPSDSVCLENGYKVFCLLLILLESRLSCRTKHVGLGMESRLICRTKHVGLGTVHAGARSVAEEQVRCWFCFVSDF